MKNNTKEKIKNQTTIYKMVFNKLDKIFNKINKTFNNEFNRIFYNKCKENHLFCWAV